MATIRVPAYRVTISNAGQAAQPVVMQRDFRGAPGDASMFEYAYGQQGTHLKVRLKGGGACQVTSRVGWHGTQLNHVSAQDPNGILIHQPDGHRFRVTVRELPRDEWVEKPVASFAAPRVTIQAAQGGWHVTFEPQQWPCVATVAVDANQVKDEALPSIPFPSNPRHGRATLFIPAGNPFKAQAGGTIRVGVRGAGLMTRATLPSTGVVTVEPAQFNVVGPQQQRFLQDDYVSQKYQEKRNQLSYG